MVAMCSVFIYIQCYRHYQPLTLRPRAFISYIVGFDAVALYQETNFAPFKLQRKTANKNHQPTTEKYTYHQAIRKIERYSKEKKIYRSISERTVQIDQVTAPASIWWERDALIGSCWCQTSLEEGYILMRGNFHCRQ